ncbi:hypothetical protein SMICM17S_01697 [Streptomyces microflavus]
MSTVSAARNKTMTRRRGGRPAAQRHDDRHRRLGVAPQTHGPGTGVAPLPVTDLTVISYGGPDVGLLAAAGRNLPPGHRVRDARLDHRWSRTTGRPGSAEAFALTGDRRGGCSCGGVHAAANPAAVRCRCGRALGSDVMRVNPQLRTVTSPYEDGEEFVAMPALRMDAALVHLNRADRLGNGQYLGPDPYFDNLFCEAADTAYVSCERLVETAELTGGSGAAPQTLLVRRHSVTGVVETPGGAHFTSCVPDHPRDEPFQKAYAAAAADPAAWAEFSARFLPPDGDEKGYRRSGPDRAGAPERPVPGTRHRNARRRRNDPRHHLRTATGATGATRTGPTPSPSPAPGAHRAPAGAGRTGTARPRPLLRRSRLRDLDDDRDPGGLTRPP